MVSAGIRGGPVPLRTAARAAKVPALHWDKVEILPKAEGAGLALPVEKSGSHYYAARATDAALLRVAAGEKKPEVKKFLFYRGTGSFRAPLTVTLDRDRKSTRLNSSHPRLSRMPSSA